MYALISLSSKLPNGFKCGFLIEKVIQEEGLYAYNMHDIEEKHLVSALHPCEAEVGWI
jgi:hypothetical protein